MIKKYLVLGFLVSSVLWGGTLWAESDINWKTSYMMVEFNPESTEVPPLECFGHNDRSAETGPCNSYAGTYNNCVWEYLDPLGYSDQNSAPQITNCYQQAGDYQITIQLIDYAANESIPLVNTFVVKPGVPSADVSTLSAEAECSDLSLGATGGDSDVGDPSDNTCTLTLNVKDQFGNPVTQIQGQTGEVHSEATFPSDANTGDLDFRTGTKLNDEFIPDETETPLDFTLGADDAVTNTFDMTSWAPSMRIEGTVLGVTEPFAYDLKFKLPTVDDLGNLDLSNTVTFEYDQYAPQVAFSPWVSLLLDIDIIPKQYTLDINTPFVITRNLLLPDSGGPNNPFDAFITVHDLHPTLVIQGIDFDPLVEAINDPVETLISVLRVAGDNAQTGGSISFSSRVEYNIEDVGIGTQEIIYPSGYLGTGLGVGDDGNDTEISTSLIGVSVEGKILGSKDAIVINDPSSFNGVQISEGESLKDIRKEVFENAVRITRSVDPRSRVDASEPILAFDPTWFNTADVVYVVDEDVIITNTVAPGTAIDMPSGQNTLVLQNGNLIIEDDLNYASNLDSFGFALINDSVEVEPATGNVFIKDDVTKIVGTYYAEGGIMSLPEGVIVVSTGDVSLSDSDNGDSNPQQIIVEGTILTHNTLGGGIYQATSDTYITPWETLDATVPGNDIRAQRYDLHYLRSYGPDFDSAEPPNQTNTDQCFPGSNPHGCYPNSAATVIRYDGRAVKTPPPGFDGASFFAR